eukprot:CAMPEP_0117756808 /NCGR_PEP_ID=MMETSP0947-20121206/14326_1 /TAXON_ID=44440 /ORGANISM="Chattonella subsalsa, Strain CCMP2191" /LENGTH=241 /DNA_ID=CAMNT_0005576521 /DNA_START=132 /DNA_END=857 /DNA_ORIENTATION=-
MKLSKKMYMSKRQNELDDLKLDISTLPLEEQKRLESLKQINENLKAVDQMEADLKNKWNFDDEEEEKDIEVLDTKWSGQAGLDISANGNKDWSDLAERPFLAFMDAAALTVFAWIGRASHGSTEFDWVVIKTALPFIVGWFGLSPLLGAYTRTAIKSQGDSLKTIIPAWAFSIPAGIAIRGAIKGEVPPTPFIVVSMVATLVVMSSWRALYIKINGDPDAEFKRGGIFDGFRMISTLIQRW